MLSDRDNIDAPLVAIINTELARIYFPTEDRLAKRITFDDGESWISIVGVVADIKRMGLDTTAKPEVYFPYLQVPSPSMSVVARSTTEPLNQTLRRAERRSRLSGGANRSYVGDGDEEAY